MTLNLVLEVEWAQEKHSSSSEMLTYGKTIYDCFAEFQKAIDRIQHTGNITHKFRPKKRRPNKKHLFESIGSRCQIRLHLFANAL